MAGTQPSFPVEIVDLAPKDLGIPDGMADITYHAMTAAEWVGC